LWWFFSSEKITMSKAGVTNAEPSADNSSISTVKVVQFTTAEGKLARISDSNKPNSVHMRDGVPLIGRVEHACPCISADS